MTASVAGRYASALFELASEQNAVASVEAALGRFMAMLDDSSELRAFVRSPLLSAEDQARALGAVLAKAGIGGTAGNFLMLVARNRRLFVVSDIVAVFRKLAAQARGEVPAEVTSALPLTEAQSTELTRRLSSIAGKTVVVAHRIDPGLLGGLVVKMGSRMIDTSLRTRLDSLGVALKASA